MSKNSDEKIESEYWIGRTRSTSRKAWNETKKASKELEKIYKQSAKELQREMANWLQQYRELHDLDSSAMKSIMNTQEAAKFRYTVKGYIDRINNLGENSPHAKELLREFDIMSGKIRFQRYEELLAQIKVQSIELTSKTNTMIQLHLEGMFKETYYREIYEVQKGLEFGTSFNIIDEQQIQRILGTPWNNKHFSNRLWGRVDDMAFSLRKTITGGIMQGKDFARMTQDLQKSIGGEYFKARRVLETETTFALERAKTESYKELGIEHYKYIATLDKVTSEQCRVFDGKIFLIKDKASGINAPPMHCFCRSVTIPFVTELKDAKRVARDMATGRIYKVPADMNYEEWLKKYGNDGKIEKEIEKNEVIKTKTTKLKDQFLSINHKFRGALIPKESRIENVVCIAGRDSITPIRDIERLIRDYGGERKDWNKNTGVIKSNKYDYEVHWYQKQGVQYGLKFKPNKEKK